VIVHEAPMTCGYGAETAARVAGRGLTSLLAPIERVTGYDTMMPYPRTESAYMPNVDDIVAAVRRTLAYT
jgi:pyruvate dehydrogenase E1 component beta subunit